MQPSLFHDDGLPSGELRSLSRDALVSRIEALRADLVSVTHERDQAIEVAEQRKTERDDARAIIAAARTRVLSWDHDDECPGACLGEDDASVCTCEVGAMLRVLEGAR
jgi:hypothetical protein